MVILTHLLYTGNEFPPPLIDGLPPHFNNETQSDVTDHSNESDFYEYDDMPALSDENFPKPYVVGKAASEADIKRNKKHSDACDKAGYWFLASDTSGVLFPPSYLFLCKLATSYAAIINRPYAYALSLRLRRVTFAKQKGLAFQLTSSPAFIPTTIEDVFEIT
jgi:hypothetical protein